jgi:hypothetical protein
LKPDKKKHFKGLGEREDITKFIDCLLMIQKLWKRWIKENDGGVKSGMI